MFEFLHRSCDRERETLLGTIADLRSQLDEERAINRELHNRALNLLEPEAYIRAVQAQSMRDHARVAEVQARAPKAAPDLGGPRGVVLPPGAERFARSRPPVDVEQATAVESNS